MKIIRYLSPVMVVIGFLGIFFMLGFTSYNEYKKAEVLSQLEQAELSKTPTVSVSNNDDNSKYNEDDSLPDNSQANSLVDLVDFSTPLPSPTKTIKPTPTKNNTTDAIGIISISQLDIKLPIYENASTDNLKKGACHITGSVYPGQAGNTCIAGHAAYTFMRIFNDIHKLNTGDLVSITYKGTVYKYKVTGKKVISPSDTSVLKGGTDKMLNLITCTGAGFTQRLVVMCKQQ